MNNFKKILFTIIFLVNLKTIIIQAQNIQNRFNYNIEYKSIIDTLWFKKKIWEITKYNKISTNPISKIGYNQNADQFNFIIVPYFKISKNGKDYHYNQKIDSIIEIDATIFEVYIKFNDSIVGNVVVIFRNNNWLGLLEVFENNSPKKVAFNIIMKTTPKNIFCIRYLEGLWFSNDSTVKVYSFYSNKITMPEDYIKQVSSDESIRNYARGIMGGLKP